MLIPTASETGESYLERIEALLPDEKTHLYFDTSFLIWLTIIGSVSRAQFVEWAGRLGERTHIPLWAMHEYYRHHTKRTLKNEIEAKATELVDAASAFQSIVGLYGDRPFFPGAPEEAYLNEVQATIERVATITKAARSWDYESSAAETLAWMNSRALARNSTFRLMRTLDSYGTARFVQELPPGYEDRDKSVNQYGDLLFWEEVVADARERGATTAIIVTRDRKEDWYSRVGQAEVGTVFKRLRDRWEPVPAPHPTLSFEMATRAGVQSLVMLDELYLGALLWKTGRPDFERLATVAMRVDPNRAFSADNTPKPIAVRARKRRDVGTLGIAAFHHLIETALGDVLPGAGRLFDLLDGPSPDVEEFVAGFTTSLLDGLSPDEAVSFAKHLHDRALKGPGFAGTLTSGLLNLIDQLDSDRAAAVYLGIVISAYFVGSAARRKPEGPVLEALFEWQEDVAVKRVLPHFRRRLKEEQSPALWVPEGSARQLRVIVENDTRQQFDPAALRQLYLDDRSLLVEGELLPDRLLGSYLGVGDAPTVRDIVGAACRYYGVPLTAVNLDEQLAEERRTVPETMGFVEFNRFTQPAPAEATAIAPLPESLLSTDGDEETLEDDEEEGE
jgi:hypothetical protein